ncbi:MULTISPECIES: hypothetical protein [Streptomyces]|uniref:Uncharacterized protein n=1 Tax=Streptomyces dengpaensis TaxID=2049881 RepID=A0ABN5IBS1_9ACTN|nr:MULTISPECIES: hypothetical protein [Streptomyces]AVH60642.1 hypothetical protein C4B68_38245 [Streptomyces dengpaensis]PIB03554.1 hypothetical protein B1C81_36835 [Streptomyces sp. HG99]
MTAASENRLALTATVVALAAEAAELETRVIELRKALAELNERMRAMSNALHQAACSAVPSSVAVDEEHSGGDRTE